MAVPETVTKLGHTIEAFPTRTLGKKGARLRIQGHSICTERTGFHVFDWNIQLDAGLSSYRTVGHCFVTHAHPDHSFNLPMAVHWQNPPCVAYVPAEAASLLRRHCDIVPCLAHGRFDPPPPGDPALVEDPSATLPAAVRDQWKYEIRGMVPGETVEITPTKGTDLQVRAYKCFHNKCPTLGYAFSTRRMKLLPEYAGLPGNELARLQKQKIPVQQAVWAPQLAYLCDTTTEVLEAHPELLEYPIIMIECTFVTGEHSKEARQRGHVDWESLRPFVERTPDVLWVLFHFSRRHTEDDIRTALARFPNVLPWLDTEDVIMPTAK
eukprot:TRINITY_DN18944_c0_g1_i1.p1 TRINITY_DN18944_c0_g1~~TRINITY_DN18944_c0_g1_i1.p1  ORF type:complete len:335 (+),score=37.84 TRINITY_DN18944_c0_g1_i1:37-1005(+)